MRRSWIVVFGGLGVLLWASSAHMSSPIVTMTVIVAALCWSAYVVDSPPRRTDSRQGERD